MPTKAKKETDSEEEKEEKDTLNDKDEEKKITDLPGIGPGTAKKLEDAGVYDLMGLVVMSPKNLSDMTGMSEAVSRKAIQAGRKMMELGFVDGMEYSQKRKDIIHVTTGSQNVDELLGGKGIESKSITEVFGAFGSGKTQIGLGLAVRTQLPKSKGGAEGKCVFIDTEGTFRPSRIKQISEKLELNPSKVLKNILVVLFLLL